MSDNQPHEAPAKRTVRYFVSYAHDDGKFPGKLLSELKKQFGACKEYDFQPWTDKQILVGQDWHKEIQSAIEQCDFGLLLVSPAFLGSTYISKNELPHFVSGKKPCMPVALCPIDFNHHDTKGLNEKQVFHFTPPRALKPRSFRECSSVNHQQDFAQELFKQIVDRLGTLHFASAAPISAPAPRATNNALKPCNLPYTSLDNLFKGRDGFLDNLHDQLKSQSAAVIKGRQAIHGMGGVGKTRAAIEYAWRHAGEYNALLFVTADSPEALDTSLAKLSGPSVLNLPEQKAQDQNVQVNAVLRWFEHNPGWLLIIDNVDNKQAVDRTENLLAKLTAGHVIITSRVADWSAQVTALGLDVLHTDDAAAFLLERTAGRRINASDDPAKARELADLLDCLALALEQAAAYIREQRLGFADYIKRWQAVPDEAIRWHDAVKMKYPRSLAITYETSVAQLSPGAQELLRMLSWLAPGPIPMSALERRLSVGPDRGKSADEETAEGKVSSSNSGGTRRQNAGAPECLSRESLVELDNLHLARILDDGQSFTVHRLLQAITRQNQTQPLPPPALVAALKWINGLFVGDPDDVRSWPVLDPLASHAQSVAKFGDQHKIPNPTARLFNQVGVLFKTKAQYHVAEPLFRRTLAISEATLGDDHPQVATRLNNLATLLQDTNRTAEAESLYRRALAIDEASLGKDHPALATDLNNLALLLHSTKQLVEAEPLYRRALAIWEASLGSDHPNVATALNNLAELLRNTGRLDQAEPLYRRALAIDETSLGKDHPTIAIRLNNLALLLEATSRLAEAEPLYRRALEIDEATLGKDHPEVATDLNNLALLLRDTNRSVEAEPLLRRALEIRINFTRVTGHRHPRLNSLTNSYRNLLLKMGDKPEQAEEKISKLLAPITQAGSP